MSLLIYKYHTCSVYYPCDKPKLYKTGDALSNTFLQNYFWHNPSLQRLSDLFLNTFLYFSTSTISTIKNWFKKDFVEDSNYTYVGKTNKFLVNETANHVWYQGVQSDEAMKTERFGCVPLQEHTQKMPLKTYFTTSKHPHSIFSTSNH